jgi:hypothetical protein
MVRDKKGTSTPLNKVIARGAFGAQLDFGDSVWAGLMLRMYPAFFNGKQTIEYPDFKPGEKVRVRVNGGASTSFG